MVSIKLVKIDPTLKDFEFIIDKFAAIHIIKRHGEGNETLANQVPVKFADFELLEEISDRFDNVEFEHNSKKKKNYIFPI